MYPIGRHPVWTKRPRYLFAAVANRLTLSHNTGSLIFTRSYTSQMNPFTFAAMILIKSPFSKVPEEKNVGKGER